MARRLGKLEAAGGASEPVPCVIPVQPGQTVQAALAAHAAAFPVRPRRFAALVVPARPTTAAEQHSWAKRFEASQLRLVAEASSERLSPTIAQPTSEAAAEAQGLKRVQQMIAAASKPISSFSAANKIVRRPRRTDDSNP